MGSFETQGKVEITHKCCLLRGAPDFSISTIGSDVVDLTVLLHEKNGIACISCQTTIIFRSSVDSSVAAFGSIARCCLLQSAGSLIELHSDLDFVGQHRGMSWGHLNEQVGSALQTAATLDVAVSINLMLITEFTTSRLQTDL